VQVIASADVAEVVQEQGGRLYVWPRTGRCCLHGLAWLEAGPQPKPGWEFEPVATEGFALYLARMARVPDELHLDVQGRRRRRVAAFWDNCAYVV
jgi:hypothetical protein